MIRLLDLFCGAGGAAMGYHRAFEAAGIEHEIVGIDIVNQPRYPFTFIQGDAMEFPLEGFDAIHASPPCQGYSIMRNLPWNQDRDYPLLLLDVRQRLDSAGVPYVIENVGGARHGAKGLVKRGLQEHGLKAGFLCGQMFGLPLYRHRYFETNWFWMHPGHGKHERIRAGSSLAGRARDIVFQHGDDGRGGATWSGRREQPAGLAVRNGAGVHGNGIGHSAGWRRAAEGLGIDWMKREELTQAIPPAFTEYIGAQLIKVLGKCDE